MALRTLEAARAWRENLENMAQMSTDAAGSMLPAAFPQLQGSGKLLPAGTRINWKGTLKRAAVDLWDREENDPDHTPALWEDILYRAGIRIIPPVITAGTAFSRGEPGWWENVLYRSEYEGANVWTPAEYPDAWVRAET